MSERIQKIIKIEVTGKAAEKPVLPDSSQILGSDVEGLQIDGTDLPASSSILSSKVNRPKIKVNGNK